MRTDSDLNATLGRLWLNLDSIYCMAESEQVCSVLFQPYSEVGTESAEHIAPHDLAELNLRYFERVLYEAIHAAEHLHREAFPQSQELRKLRVALDMIASEFCQWYMQVSLSASAGFLDEACRAAHDKMDAIASGYLYQLRQAAAEASVFIGDAISEHGKPLVESSSTASDTSTTPAPEFVTLSVDEKSHKITYEGRSILLPGSEQWNAFLVLYKNGETPVSREAFGDRAENTISELRKSLRAKGLPGLARKIVKVRDVGYLIDRTKPTP